jgi:hypothetical protein
MLLHKTLQRTMQGQVNSHIYTALQRHYVMPSTASTAASRCGENRLFMALHTCMAATPAVVRPPLCSLS